MPGLRGQGLCSCAGPITTMNDISKTVIPDGAFLVARKAFESDLWRNKPASWLKIWFYILGHVQHSQYKELGRGEGYFNFTRLCKMKAFGPDVTINHVEKFTAYARSSGMIKTRRSTHGVVVLVCKYDLYQKLSNFSGDRSGELSGAETASALRLEQSVEAEEQADTATERKRNRSGDINKNGNNDNNARPAAKLTKEEAWDRYATKAFKEKGITSSAVMGERRAKYLQEGRVASEKAVLAFVDGAFDQPARNAVRSAGDREREKKLYPNGTEQRLGINYGTVMRELGSAEAAVEAKGGLQS